MSNFAWSIQQESSYEFIILVGCVNFAYSAPIRGPEAVVNLEPYLLKFIILFHDGLVIMCGHPHIKSDQLAQF